MSLLPVAGEDGTLATRFREYPEAQAIRTKTGSLSHVRVEVNRLLDQIGVALIE